jgi:hypothetical protein
MLCLHVAWFLVSRYWWARTRLFWATLALGAGPRSGAEAWCSPRSLPVLPLWGPPPKWWEGPRKPRPGASRTTRSCRWMRQFPRQLTSLRRRQPHLNSNSSSKLRTRTCATLACEAVEAHAQKGSGRARVWCMAVAVVVGMATLRAAVRAAAAAPATVRDAARASVALCRAMLLLRAAVAGPAAVLTVA